MGAAECSIQRSFADCFRTSELPFRCEHLRYLEQLSASNIRNDPSWLDAIIVTLGNHVHCAVTEDRVTRLARRLVPLLKWKLLLKDETARQLPQRLIERMYKQCTDA